MVFLWDLSGAMHSSRLTKCILSSEAMQTVSKYDLDTSYYLSCKKIELANTIIDHLNQINTCDFMSCENNFLYNLELKKVYAAKIKTNALIREMFRLCKITELDDIYSSFPVYFVELLDLIISYLFKCERYSRMNSLQSWCTNVVISKLIERRHEFIPTEIYNMFNPKTSRNLQFQLKRNTMYYRLCKNNVPELIVEKLKLDRETNICNLVSSMIIYIFKQNYNTRKYLM